VEPERAYDRQTIKQPSTLGRAFVIAVVSAGTLGASGCGIGWQDWPISRVSVSGDGRSLDVGWHCHQDADVEVEESKDEVRLRLRVSSYRGDCADVERATLSSALVTAGSAQDEERSGPSTLRTASSNRRSIASSLRLRNKPVGATS
jgi:hypothetical protein